MAILKQISTQTHFAGGIKDLAHGAHIAEEAGVAADDFEVIFNTDEVQKLRRKSYSAQSDYLFFDYMAAVAEFGDSSAQANTAKTAWLTQREAVKAQFPK
jgi:hypothetical protein